MFWISFEDPCWSHICCFPAWNVGILRPLPSGVAADAVTDRTLVLREVVEPSTQIFALLRNPWEPMAFQIFEPLGSWTTARNCFFLFKLMRLEFASWFSSGWGMGCVNALGTCVLMMLRYRRLSWTLPLLECLKTRYSYGPNDMCETSPYSCGFTQLMIFKKNNSWGQLENTLSKEIRLETAHDTFQAMKLRVPELVRPSEIHSMGIASIPFTWNPTNMISYHGLIWAVDLV